MQADCFLLKKYICDLCGLETATGSLDAGVKSVVKRQLTPIGLYNALIKDA